MMPIVRRYLFEISVSVTAVILGALFLLGIGLANERRAEHVVTELQNSARTFGRECAEYQATNNRYPISVAELSPSGIVGSLASNQHITLSYEGSSNRFKLKLFYKYGSFEREVRTEADRLH